MTSSEVKEQGCIPMGYSYPKPTQIPVGMGNYPYPYPYPQITIRCTHTQEILMKWWVSFLEYLN
eukprot:CAMPEP_0172491992 /NCGR_PEP_ID=MMETSP1066-20121228/22963_1 /TAXON_ID=671091 /ORGANISM="Coscinodiscus wailesii, Strain CCMP2513" /LENGTH=63 /DNA_ID=CAMNT_0013261341 /DNA_START=56 /DNA_END=244 /DNA_ORIENTATION=-